MPISQWKTMLPNLFHNFIWKLDIYFHMCLEPLILMAPSHITIYTSSQTITKVHI